MNTHCPKIAGMSSYSHNGSRLDGITARREVHSPANRHTVLEIEDHFGSPPSPLWLVVVYFGNVMMIVIYCCAKQPFLLSASTHFEYVFLEHQSHYQSHSASMLQIGWTV